MAGITVACGVLLILLGAGSFAYAWATMAEVAFTALIPAAIGLVLAILGALSFKDSLRKHTMHAAAALASLTFMACVVKAAPGVYVMYFTNGKVERPLAIQCQAVTAAIMLVFVGLCVNSFIQARRNRVKADAAKPTT